MTAIIDYGAGNLHSVKNALAYLGADSVVTDDANVLLQADRVILPGVGAFGDAMANLRARGLDKTIHALVRQGTPLFGICLGLQLLFEKSDETPDVQGLGVLRGSVERIAPAEGLKIPHMGWNDIIPAKDSRILQGLGNQPYLYFVHSYYICPQDESVVSAYTDYGARIAIAVEDKNVFATQFHPEKSGAVGLKILENFLKL